MAGLARLLLPSHAVRRCEAVYDMTISRQEIFALRAGPRGDEISNLIRRRSRIVFEKSLHPGYETRYADGDRCAQIPPLYRTPLCG